MPSCHFCFGACCNNFININISCISYRLFMRTLKKSLIVSSWASDINNWLNIIIFMMCCMNKHLSMTVSFEFWKLTTALKLNVTVNVFNFFSPSIVLFWTSFCLIEIKMSVFLKEILNNFLKVTAAIIKFKCPKMVWKVLSLSLRLQHYWNVFLFYTTVSRSRVKLWMIPYIRQSSK